jgi:ABC-type antimicrobial peptide transport system permease subunit
MTAIRKLSPFLIAEKKGFVGCRCRNHPNVAFLMGIFGIIALILCAMGVCGIVANSVAERRHEIGIRMGLGAQPFHVFRNVGGTIPGRC